MAALKRRSLQTGVVIVNLLGAVAKSQRGRVLSVSEPRSFSGDWVWLAIAIGSSP
jgi:hypothetical protein